MKQHINLVNPALLPPKPFFQLHRMILALAAIALTLLLVWVLIQAPVQAHEAAAATAQQRLVAKEAQLKLLTQQLSQRRSDPRYASEIAHAQQTGQDLQAIAAMLKTQSSASTPSYSDYLHALGQTGVNSVWLRDIRLDGSQIALEGLSLRAAALPEYLAALNQQAAFKGMRFQHFELGQQAAGTASTPAALVFRLESAGMENRP